MFSPALSTPRHQSCTDLLNDRAKDLPHHVTGGRSIHLLTDVLKMLIGDIERQSKASIFGQVLLRARWHTEGDLTTVVRIDDNSTSLGRVLSSFRWSQAYENSRSGLGACPTSCASTAPELLVIGSMRGNPQFRTHYPGVWWLFPPSPREWLLEDHVAYCLSDLVDEFKLVILRSILRGSLLGSFIG